MGIIRHSRGLPDGLSRLPRGIGSCLSLYGTLGIGISHRIKEGVDKELVKRIAILAGTAIFIIGLCVGMMYIV